MGKKSGKENRADNSNHLGQQDKELILAISELPDGIILEVYFDDEG